jgi:hypothetical protein
MQQSSLRPEFVEFIPERLFEGFLYISKRYRTASHLCCCGCGLEVVTPLNPAKWQLIEHPDGKVSLRPSIGNWSSACKSHYFMTKNSIQWAGSMSPEEVEAVRAADLRDVAALAKASKSRWATFGESLLRLCTSVATAIKSALRD